MTWIKSPENRKLWLVTVLVAVAKLVAGPRAAAVTGVIGTLIAVVLLIQLG